MENDNATTIYFDDTVKQSIQIGNDLQGTVTIWGSQMVDKKIERGDLTIDWFWCEDTDGIDDVDLMRIMDCDLERVFANHRDEITVKVKLKSGTLEPSEDGETINTKAVYKLWFEYKGEVLEPEDLTPEIFDNMYHEDWPDYHGDVDIHM